jgi:2-keto-4-pentenoate hydratase/2-oxohepta-3-ene-1,7-dioic acid hydratase in catechol pathway
VVAGFTAGARRRILRAMKLARFRFGGEDSAGLVDGDRVADLGLSAGQVMELLEHDLWRDLAARRPRRTLALGEVELLAPVPRPRKFLAIGLNYAAHRAESERTAGIKPASAQIWFNKQVTCVNGPYAPIEMPRVSHMLDYEGELGLVIGRRARHVAAADARALIAGYLVVDDVSVRDWQRASPTMTLGKSFDTHGPIGPWLVSPDEISDPARLTLTTHVNGELRQQASTGEMIHSIGEQIAHLTQAFTLEPGDLLSTGTPAGPGGMMVPPRYLAVGDVVRIEISGIGHIENRVVPEGQGR